MVKLEEPVRPLHALLHPLWWTSVGLLLLNDHLLKGGGTVAPAVTGKLSDVSGLLMAPALVAALLRIRTFGGWLACHAGVALTFAALKLSPFAREAFIALGAVFGLDYAVAPDPGDLWAIASALVSLLVFRKVHDLSVVSTAWMRVASALGLGLGLVGTVATSKAGPGTHVALAADEVHVIDDRPSIDIHDARTGKLERSVPFDMTDPVEGLTEGLLTTHDGRILDARSGRELFRFPADNGAIGTHGRIVIGCLDEQSIGAFEVDTKSLVWKRALRCEDRQSLVSEGIVAVFDGTAHAVLLDAPTGRSLDKVAASCSKANWSCAGKLRELDAFHPELAGFELRDGLSVAQAKITRRMSGRPVVLWKTDPPDGLLHVAVFHPATRDSLWAAPAQALVVVTPTLVVTEFQYELEAHDASTGVLRWRHAEVGSAYAANDEILVFLSTSSANGVVALELGTGRRVWRAQTR